MRKVAVFGNAGGGKSTLARRLAEIAGLPLYVIDHLEYFEGRYEPGRKLSPEAFAALHEEIVSRDAWIIDGFGGAKLAWRRFEAADTLVHVDLPLALHYWGVTKRLAGGLWRTPPGWPEGSPLWESSWQSYRVVWLCHTKLTPRYRDYVAKAGERAHRLRCYDEMARFLDAASREER